MTAYALMGALQLGLIYALVALGVFLTFRVLDFPDLTVDGSLPLGAATAAALIVSGVDPWLATFAAVGVGAMAGLVTAFLAVRCGILHLLASILTMLASFSIVIRIMGRPNLSLIGEDTVMTPFLWLGIDPIQPQPLFIGVIVLIVAILLIRFLNSDLGLALRATGADARMVRANGGNTAAYTYLGLALSNGLVALAGALFAQTSGFADVTSAPETIVFGLAAVILGETLLPSRRIWVMALACILGSVVYRVVVQFALTTSGDWLKASDLKLITALLVVVALVAPKMRAGLMRRQAK